MSTLPTAKRVKEIMRLGHSTHDIAMIFGVEEYRIWNLLRDLPEPTISPQREQPVEELQGQGLFEREIQGMEEAGHVGSQPAKPEANQG